MNGGDSCIKMEAIMRIEFDKKYKVFHLATTEMSYYMQITKRGFLSHVYFGKVIETIPEEILEANNNLINPDVIRHEYSGSGLGDYRTPSYKIRLESGHTTSELIYVTHRIYKGKVGIEGLPSTYCHEDGAMTLEIDLEDKVGGFVVTLFYTIFDGQGVISRHTRFHNTSPKPLTILSALSASVDFSSSAYDLLQLSGAWSREKHVYRRKLVPGFQGVESKRGISSHQQNPFIALLAPDTTEYVGEVYGFSLVYSGNFLANVEVDSNDLTRVSIGINPSDFSWCLKPSEYFNTPEAIMVYSACGLSKMSRMYHKLFRENLIRGHFKEKERPILINNWEATYFDFKEEKILEIAKAAQKLGIELFVLDDGWFGKRDSDNCSLGDWVVDHAKLPSGMKDLAERINGMGMDFGLWFEPEMVSQDSDLYRAHPEWCLQVPSRTPGSYFYQRTQMVLDLSKPAVRDYIVKSMTDILESTPISYVKWDMNRPLSDIGSNEYGSDQQQEIAHRYVLGLYEVMERITTAFPMVLFESCSSGGGRYDPGMLYYMPQTWTSDDSDAIERLKIQYGTSLIYPAISMGAHVANSPNHQVGRRTSLDIRGHVAMAGNYGYEVDITKFSNEEKSLVQKQVTFYKSIRKTVQLGEQFRLKSPFESNECGWLYRSQDQQEVVVTYTRVLAEAYKRYQPLKLMGVKHSGKYRVQLFENQEVVSESIIGGDFLTQVGLTIPELEGDFVSCMWQLKVIND